MEKEIGWLLQEKYDGKMTSAAKKDIERLRAGEPLDHIIGFVDFLGCKILVDNKVLIPRFETEFWVQEVISEIYNNSHGRENRSIKVLDMFSGSGCIGVAVAKNIETANVVLIDSQKEAVKQIKKNCSLNNISKDRYQIIQSDIFLNVTGKFDYIFANPPYIPTTKKNKIQTSVLDYEPEAALFGGADGLLYIEMFLAQAKKFLKPGAKIFMEFDSPQKPAIEVMVKKNGYGSCEFHKDQYGKQRWVVIQ